MELEVFNKKELTDNEKQFIDLHNRIIVSAKLTADYLYDFCNQLKQMRDEKTYKYVGLKTFEEYAVEVLGLKKSQAYNFCSIADNVSYEIFQSIGKNASTTKLLLLSKLDPDEQKEIVDSKATLKTVSELKKEISKLKNVDKENEKLKREIHELTIENKQLSFDLTTKKEVVVRDENDIKQIELLKEQVERLSVNNNNNLSQFKNLFEMIKRDLVFSLEVINTFDDAEQAKCKTALKRLLDLI